MVLQTQQFEGIRIVSRDEFAAELDSLGAP